MPLREGGGNAVLGKTLQACFWELESTVSVVTESLDRTIGERSDNGNSKQRRAALAVASLTAFIVFAAVICFVLLTTKPRTIQNAITRDDSNLPRHDF